MPLYEVQFAETVVLVSTCVSQTSRIVRCKNAFFVNWEPFSLGRSIEFHVSNFLSVSSELLFVQYTILFSLCQPLFRNFHKKQKEGLGVLPQGLTFFRTTAPASGFRDRGVCPNR